MKRITLIFAALMAASAMLSAQNPWQRQLTPGDTLTPVRLLANGDAVFSVYAPNAKAVTLGGDIVPWGQRLDPSVEDGIWSFTIPSPVPGTYRYNYVIDGVKVIDPRSQLASETSSIATIAPTGEEFFAKKDVPHGAVAERHYHSNLFNATRRLHVWTPAGYEKGEMELPVLYLVHGGGDNDLSWNTAGAAGDILDNLMAEGKMNPMVVVMPNGSFDAAKFPQELVESIIPFIEANYKVKTGAANRALSGLSMGGLETLNTMLSDYDKFEWFWVMSSGWFANQDEANQAYVDRLNAIATDFNAKVRMLVFSQGGKSDIAYDNCVYMLGKFDAAGVKYEKFLDLDGDAGHSWITWRRDLYHLAQRLFK